MDGQDDVGGNAGHSLLIEPDEYPDEPARPREELSDDEAALIRQQRGGTRAAITKAHTYLVSAGYRRSTKQLPTAAKLDDWTNKLIEYDYILDEDGDSAKYYIKIKEITEIIETITLNTGTGSIALGTPPPGIGGIAPPNVSSSSPVTAVSTSSVVNPSQSNVAQSTNVFTAPLPALPPPGSPPVMQPQAMPTSPSSQSPPASGQTFYQPLNVPTFQQPVYSSQQPVYPYYAAYPVLQPLTQDEIAPFDGTHCNYRQFEELFEELIEKDVTFTPARKFLKYKNLVGKHGERFLCNLKATMAGLATAKQRMKDFYDDPHAVRTAALNLVDQLGPISWKQPIEQLRDAANVFERSLQTLKDSGAGTQYINEIFFRSVFSKLPQQLQRHYTRAHATNDAEELLKAFLDEVKVLASVNLNSNLPKSNPASTAVKRTGPKAPKANVYVVNTSSPIASSSQPIAPSSTQVIAPITPTSRPPKKCLLCDGAHLTIWCKEGDANARKTIAKQKKLCLLCLRTGHFIAGCSSRFTCVCGQKHSSVICDVAERRRTPPPGNVPSNANQQQAPNGAAGTSATISTVTLSHILPQHNNDTCLIDPELNVPFSTYLMTVLASINGHTVRILLDSGAEVSLISERLATQLHLPTFDKKRTTVSAPLGGDSSVQVSDRRVRTRIDSLTETNNLDAVLCVLPSMHKIELAALPEAVKQSITDKGYRITDASSENVAQYPIEVVIGARYFLGLIKSVPISLTPTLMIVHTIFDWAVSGSGVGDEDDSKASLNFITTENQYNQSLLRGERDSNKTDKALEEDYLRATERDKVRLIDGRYEVKLPWIEPVTLADNHHIALRRLNRGFQTLIKKNMYALYNTTITDLIRNFAEIAPSYVSTPNRTYYMPHSCILRPDKETTKIRIVFDASSHAPDSKSLNDFLYKGITNWDALTLFNKFRFGAVAVISDIEKAFLMISVNKVDRDALRFLWFNEEHEPTSYRFKVVPFGTSSSPFLLYMVLFSHFNHHRSSYNDVIPQIEYNMYVDDLMIAFTHAPDVREMNLFKSRTVDLFQLGGMKMTKWRSNVTALDNLWSPGANPLVKTLGHQWDTTTDQLSLVIDCDEALTAPITKRSFSSVLSSIYDPLGFVSPFLIKLRLQLRIMWESGYDWDDDLPSELIDDLRPLLLEVPLVKQVTVPRDVLSGCTDAKLIVYCDASKEAYGFVAYCLTSSATRLITAKGKLAPKTTCTIPILELKALALGAESAKQLSSLYHFNAILIISDSMINLQRLEKHPNEMEPALAIRLAKIKQQVPGAIYQHATTKQNIADVVSRGCLMSELLANRNWWSCPPLEVSTKFSKTIDAVFFSAVAKTNVSNCNCTSYFTYGKHLNVFRVFARYLTRVLPRYTTVPEDQLATTLLLRSVQHKHFLDDIRDLEENSKLTNPFSILKNFDCFLDEDGLLRLRTRLEKCDILTHDEKNPIILPERCIVSRRITEDAHKRMNHAGVDRIQNCLRERYFILKGRRLIRSVAHHCSLCVRKRSCTADPIHGAIPQFRLAECSPPFANTGVDIFGPLKINITPPGKRYGLIFTCATTRAVHLEIMSDMTADQVLLAMRRFFARRGIPHLIYSDNGSQLLKVRRQLVSLIKELRTFNPHLELRFSWVLQSAISPWRGGFFERLIRTIKEALLALTFKKKIKEDELQTIIVEIERHLNDRPLFTYGTGVISPSMFFNPTRLSQLPPLGNKVASAISRDAASDLKDEYIKSKRHVNAVWRAWREKYLISLRNFHENPSKGHREHKYEVGDIVILKNNTVMDTWPLGLIEQVHPSPDGIIRSVTVRAKHMAHPESKVRSVQSIIPLECAREVNFYTPPTEKVTQGEDSPPREM